MHLLSLICKICTLIIHFSALRVFVISFFWVVPIVLNKSVKKRLSGTTILLDKIVSFAWLQTSSVYVKYLSYFTYAVSTKYVWSKHWNFFRLVVEPVFCLLDWLTRKLLCDGITFRQLLCHSAFVLQRYELAVVHAIKDTIAYAQNYWYKIVPLLGPLKRLDLWRIHNIFVGHPWWQIQVYFFITFCAKNWVFMAFL